MSSTAYMYIEAGRYLETFIALLALFCCILIETAQYTPGPGVVCQHLNPNHVKYNDSILSII